jgi:opacity protein-like surface antigen
MKKIILTALAVASFNTTALGAGNLAMPLDSQFYIRADATWGKFKTDSIAGSSFTQPYKIKNLGKFNMGVEVGAGYNFTDDVRIELVFNRPFDTHFKGTQNFTKLDYTSALVSDIAKALNVSQADQTTINTAKSIATANMSVVNKTKTNVKALILRTNMDVLELGMVKFFISGGIGAARVSHRLTKIVNISNIALKPSPVALPSDSLNITDAYKSKHRNNIVWSAGLGASVEILDGLRAEIAYRLTDYGKTKKLSDTKDRTLQGTDIKLQTQTVSAGVRFAL